MKRKLLVSFEIDVADLTRAERQECARAVSVKPRDLPRLDEVSADDLGRIIANAIESSTAGDEMFGGSGIYAKFECAKLVGAEFKDRAP